MFHFPGCPPVRLWIHLTVTGHYPGRVPPFGYPGINAYLQLPQAFRSLSRPSSAISALASTLRSYTLDLASTLSLENVFRSNIIPKTIEIMMELDDLCRSQPPLLTGIFRVRCSRLNVSFPVQFSRCEKKSEDTCRFIKNLVG